MNNKRGISDVITTVLMILLVIAAIAVLWVVIGNFLSSGTDSVSTTTDCMQTRLEVMDATVKHPRLPDGSYGQEVNVQVKRISGNGLMEGVNVIVNGQPLNYPGNLQIGEYKVYSSPIKNGPSFEEVNGGVSVAASAVFTGGNACPKSDDILLRDITPECSDRRDNDKDGFTDTCSTTVSIPLCDPDCNNDPDGLSESLA